MSKSPESEPNPESSQPGFDVQGDSIAPVEDYVLYAKRTGREPNPPTGEDVLRATGLLFVRDAVRALRRMTKARGQRGRHSRG